MSHDPIRCAMCHGRKFWISIHDRRLCAACHPPADPGLVKEWITAESSPVKREVA